MKLPAITGVIERRILANYRIDAQCVADVLPKPFRPKLVKGCAIGGICLIRLKKIRPSFVPIPCGLSSENAAHRIAVEWDEDDVTREGVYIPRRDTDSKLNTLAGGTLFPGVYHHAKFNINEKADQYSVAMRSYDGETHLHVSGKANEKLPSGSVFGSLEEASQFFEKGALGYSASEVEGVYDGFELDCKNWAVQSLEIDKIESSFFDDKLRFPKGSVIFDNALLMRDIDHQWLGRDELCCQ